MKGGGGGGREEGPPKKLRGGGLNKFLGTKGGGLLEIEFYLRGGGRGSLNRGYPLPVQKLVTLHN